jgi:hypothetical protein
MFANANKLEKSYTDEDILHFFLKNKEYASTISNMKEQDKINVNVEIRSCPLLPTINIAPSLKISGRDPLETAREYNQNVWVGGDNRKKGKLRVV